MMDDNFRTASDVATYRSLNPPEEVVVKEDSSGAPVRLGRGSATTVTIEDQWRIDDEWWRREPISRMYYLVRLNTGQRLTIYKDLIKGSWHKQRY